ESSRPATFSESWSFIWQPNVSRKNVPRCFSRIGMTGTADWPVSLSKPISNGLLILKSQLITPALAPKNHLPGSHPAIEHPPEQAAEVDTFASYLLRAPYACATFLKPGKILFSLRGTSFFCSQRFLKPLSSRFSNKPAGSLAGSCCFF